MCIRDRVDGVFYSSIICERDKIEEVIDARTSDAIALALRFKAPIFTYENILLQMEFGFTDWRALHLYCVRLLRGARVAQWRASTASSFRQLRNLTEPGLRRPGVRAPLR